MLRREQSIDDGAGVVAFEPAIGGDGSAAGTVGAGVHHDHAVAGAQEEFRLADYAHAVVRDAMEDEDPAPIGIFRADFPAAEQGSVRGAHIEILAGRAGGGKGGVGFAKEIGSQLATKWMKEGRSGKPSSDSREERREEQ